MRFIKKIISILTFPFRYPVIIINVMIKKHHYDKTKKQAWGLFYKRNKIWLNTWYNEKGLNSKPPVIYDQGSQRFIKLNRQARRLHSKRIH
jgi:hypothetical protein